MKTDATSLISWIFVFDLARRFDMAFTGARNSFKKPQAIPLERTRSHPDTWDQHRVVANQSQAKIRLGVELLAL